MPLPVKIRGPVARLRFVQETTAAAKDSDQALGAQVLTAISDWTVPNLLVETVRLASKTHPYNLIITNVPGPSIPLYLNGARMTYFSAIMPI